jgi:tripartite-type tricarboxylate transporter receptor subunit TctC
MMLARRLLMALAAAVPLALGADKVLAAEVYPTRPITMLVPFAAGGPSDTVARLLAESMTRALGQQVIVENVGGAGGTLGTRRVARADPDGYTLLLHHISQATSAVLYRKLPYDTLTDFAPVALIAEVPMAIVARSDLPPNSVGELLDCVRANKDEVAYGHAGIGSASHLCGMLLMDALDTRMTTVPYKGTGPAMTDLLGGQIDLMCDQATSSIGHIKSGKIKPYAVTSTSRMSALPELPTLDEAGLGGLELTVWYGLYTTKGAPKAAIDKLQAALRAALQDPRVLERFADLATQPVALDRVTPEALQRRLEQEIARWRPIVQAAGVYAD